MRTSGLPKYPTTDFLPLDCFRAPDFMRVVTLVCVTQCLMSWRPLKALICREEPTRRVRRLCGIVSPVVGVCELYSGMRKHLALIETAGTGDCFFFYEHFDNVRVLGGAVS